MVQPEDSPYTIPHLKGRGGNRNMRILLDSEVRNKISLRNFNDIKGILLSPRFTSLFGNMKPEVDWKEDRVTLAIRQPGIFGEPSISIGGVDIEETGMAFDLVIPDDLVGRTNINTQDQLAKTIRHFQDYGSLLDKGGLMLMLGTFWHHQDLYHFIRNNPEIISQFDWIRWPAVDEKNRLFFPRELSRDKLADEKAKQGSHYYPQYMLQVLAGEDQLVDKANIRYFRVQDEEIYVWDEGEYKAKGLKVSDLSFSLTCDEAYTKEKYADFTGIVVKGEDKDGNWYIFEAKRGKWLENRTLDELEILYQTYPIIVGGIETARFNMLSQALSQRGIYVKELKHRGRAKFSRFRALEPRFAQKRIFIKREHSDLEYEILCWTRTGFRGEHDDLSDALSYQLDLGTFQVKKRKPLYVTGSQLKGI